MGLTDTLSALLIVASILIVVVLIYNFLVEDDIKDTFKTRLREKFGGRLKEGFISMPDDAYVSDTGAIKSTGIITNGMRTKPWKDIQDEVRSKGYASDGVYIGASPGDAFSPLYENQKEINAIDQRTSDGVMDLEDLSLISKKIGASANNNAHNLYNRGGSKPTKMVLSKNEIRGVIDEKYLPYRDKNQQLAVVGTIIEIPGFDVTPERFEDDLKDTHFSAVLGHKKTARVPTAAGAAGASSKLDQRGDIGLSDSPTAKAVADSVKLVGDKLMIATGVDESGTKEVISTPAVSTPENATIAPPVNYAAGNTMHALDGRTN